MMKIIHLISNKQWGGGEQYALDLILRQKHEGHDVEVVTSMYKTVKEHFQNANITATTLLLGGGFRDFLSPLALALKLRKVNGPVVIHVHNFGDAFVAIRVKMLLRKSVKVKVVVTRHLVKKAKTSLLFTWLYKYIDELIFVSRLAKNEFLSSQPTIQSTKIHVVYNAVVVPKDIEPRDLKRELSLPSDTVVAMYHGRLVREKGLEILLKAFAEITEQCPKMVLVLLGGGMDNYERYLQNLTAVLNISNKVFFVGFQTNVYPYIASCDIGVVPTIAPEAFGLSCAEYMALGKPLITTANGAQRELVDTGENGILVPPESVSSLANAIRLLYIDRELAGKLGKSAAKKIATNYDYDGFYSKIMSIYGL